MKSMLTATAAVFGFAAAAAAASSASTLSGASPVSRGSSLSSLRGATSYPTTVTRVWSRTKTQGVQVTLSTPADSAGTPAVDPAAYASSEISPPTDSTVAIFTVTMYEPWTASPNPERYPYILTQTAITRRKEYAHVARASSHGSSHGSSHSHSRMDTDTAGASVGSASSASSSSSASSVPVTSFTRTATTTWHIWDTSPTDLPIGVQLPECRGGCAPPLMKPDKRCIDRALETACHSQCKIRYVEGVGSWWCQERTGNSTSEVAIGRVCTDSNGYYEQLLEPCDRSDHRMNCPPCV